MKYRILNQWSVDNGEQQPVICHGTFDEKEKAIKALKFFKTEDEEMAENNGWEIIEDSETAFYAADKYFPLESFTKIEIVQFEDEFIVDETSSLRIRQLKAMHEIMCTSNDESVYHRWVTLGIPDCPTYDDYEYIANNTESYNETFEYLYLLV